MSLSGLKDVDSTFVSGMEADATGLGDSLDEWDKEYKGKSIDGAFIVAGTDTDSDKAVQKLVEKVKAAFGASINIAKIEFGVVRQAPMKDHEQSV